jgi:hypothetical protein
MLQNTLHLVFSWFSWQWARCFRNGRRVVQHLNPQAMTNNSRLSIPFIICILLIVLASVPSFAQQLAGAWEGSYSESRRVIVFGMDFESETKGTLRILGKEIPITAMRAQSGGVEIRTEGNDPTVFRGKEEGNVITRESFHNLAVPNGTRTAASATQQPS